MVPKLCACCGWYRNIHWGTLFLSPEDDPLSVKVGGSYPSDVRFCPDIDFCDVFTLPIIKDTLAYKGLYIACKLRKGNVRASFMHIGVSSTKKLKQYANRMNVSRTLSPPSFSLSKVAISRLEYE